MTDCGTRIYRTRVSQTRILCNQILLIAIATATVCTLNVRLMGIELIENGSFESDPDNFGRLRTAWDDGSGIRNDIGFGIHDYPTMLEGQEEGASFPGGFELPPGATAQTFTGIVRPRDAGRFYGALWGVWNGDGVGGFATQVVSLDGDAGVPYDFSAWLASRRADPDYALVTLEFFAGVNATGDSLGSIRFDGNDQSSSFIVGSLNLEGLADPSIPATQDNWTLYRTAGQIPISARSAAVTIRSGLDIYGYVDIVSLQVVPEPSSAVLAALLGAVGAVWYVRRRATAHRD